MIRTLLKTKWLPAASLACLSLTLVSAQSAESIQNLVNIRFQNDIRLFTVMAALNAAGFDEETHGDEIRGVRKAVREELASLDPDLQSRLQNFYEAKLAEMQSTEQPQAAYTSLALLLSGPPDFELLASEEDTPADAQHVRGFEVLVRELYRKIDIQGLWEKYRPAYEQELLAYQPVLREIIRNTLDFFRVPARVVLDREIVLIPDLLDKKGVVNARNLERVYYIVVGPSDTPDSNRRQLQHEYLHFLVDPLVRKFGVSLMEHQDLLDLAQRQPRIRSEYQNRYLLMVTESLIEAIQLAVSEHQPETRQRELVRLFRQGLVLAPHFMRGLQAYAESKMVSLPSYIETMLDSVDPEQVEKDEKQIAELELEIREADEKARARAEAERLKGEQQQEINRLLRAATHLLQEGQPAAARDELENLLELEPDHGSAWFYMAQIAAQQQDYDRALMAYQKSAESMDSPTWVRAWAQVRIGRILAARGRFEEARQHFESVLKLEGDLHGARERAQESLHLLDRQP